MSSQCTLLGYTQQANYKKQDHRFQQQCESELIIQQVQKHRLLEPRLGSRKLVVLLEAFIKEHQIKMGRDAMFDLLRTHRLLVNKRIRTVQTTMPKHWHQKYPNLIR